MSCPTCDETIHTIAVTDGTVHRHCPRCGTYVADYGPSRHTTVPTLVGRCREFEKDQVRGTDPEPKKNEPCQNAWLGSGIPEAINLPGDRP